MTNSGCYGNIYKQSIHDCELNLGVFPSGQWGQTVNLLLFSFGGSNPPAPTKNSSVFVMLEFLFYLKLYKAYPRVDLNSIDPPNRPAGKKLLCNSDDRCQRQKQGGAVGAAASRMRVLPKARRSRWEPRPGLLILRGLRNPPAPTKK